MKGDSQLPPSVLATGLPLCFHSDFTRSRLLVTAALGEQSESHKSKSLPEPLSLSDSVHAAAVSSRHPAALKLTDGGGALPLGESLCGDFEGLEE